MMRFRGWIPWSVAGLCLWTAVILRGAETAGWVATARDPATEAGLAALAGGGNAVDAAVAAGLMLGVVDGYNSGIGGGCFMVIQLADGRRIAIDGRETAPARATRDMFLREGKGDPELSQTGALAVGVPGALAAYEDAVRHFGKLGLKRPLLAAARTAEEGFRVDRSYAARLRSAAGELARFPSSRAVLLDPSGDPWKEGSLLRQPDLARSYRAIASEGTAWFYSGAFARATGEWMGENGGILTARDFSDYRVRRREPVVSTYRGYEIVGFPPPSSGGVHVAQILNVLEGYDLKAMGLGSADFVHVVAESMKLAFADRAHWLGDPDFVPVPLGLTSKEYARRLAGGIDMRRVSPVKGHSTPEEPATRVFGRHTTHFSAADAEGNWVACTATINTTFGSKVVVPGTGVVLNNEMDDFSAQPGVPNFFGLIGAEANAVGPGKRPLSSMSPTIVLKEGRPVLAVGAAGGPTIISQTVLAILHTIDFGLDPRAALAQGRFHHQWLPDSLKIERSLGGEVMEELERRGHRLSPVDSFGAAQAVGRSGEGGMMAVRDPRVE